MCIWDTNSTKRPIKNFNAGFNKVFSTSSNEKWISVCGVNYSVDVYDAKSMKLFKSIPCNLFKLADAILTYHAKFFDEYMITADNLGKLVVFDAKNFNVVFK